MDVIRALNALIPSPQFGGCIEYEYPNGDGAFTAHTLEEVQSQYESLRWEDERPKPTWEEIVTYDGANPPLAPLVDRLTIIIDTLTDEQQASFGSLIAPAYVALINGRPTVARLIVANATIDPEFQSLKDALLAEFDRG